MQSSNDAKSHTMVDGGGLVYDPGVNFSPRQPAVKQALIAQGPNYIRTCQ